MIRLFIPDPLHANAVISPSPDQVRYLLSVMRLKAGDELLLFNGRDGEWRGLVADVTKRACTLKIDARTRDQVFPPELDLVVALVKRARLETIVEKAAELGARRVRLVITRRTNADHTNIARLQAIAAEAAEQAGRLDVPEIVAPQKIGEMLENWDENQWIMFCDESGDNPAEAWGGGAGRAFPALVMLKNAAQHDAQQNTEKAPPWAVLIGPEGGFAPEERARLRSLPFVAPVSLGPRILRADTAAIAALTLWQAALGDW